MPGKYLHLAKNARISQPTAVMISAEENQQFSLVQKQSTSPSDVENLIKTGIQHLDIGRNLAKKSSRLLPEDEKPSVTLMDNLIQTNRRDFRKN